MLETQRLASRWLLAALLAGLYTFALTLTAAAQESTDRRLQEVAAQKAEADVRTALRESERLASTSPDKAVARLRKALDRIEDEAALSDDRRATLRRMLKDRIRVAELGNAADPADKKAKDGKRLADDRDDAQRLLDSIKKLQREGKLDETRRQAKELADNRINSVADQVAANRQLQNERERRTGDVIRNVDRSGLPSKGDIEFPKDWKERTKNRTPVTTRMTAKEKAVLSALDSLISVRFRDSRLEDVIEYIQDRTGQSIVLDKVALEDVGVSYDSPVSVSVKGVTVRFLLRKILGDLGLTYVVKDEVIQVVSTKQAKDLMSVQVYYIGDLARNRFQAAVLIDLIQSTIEPESWKANGGTGSIYYNPITRSLVIKQTSEFHSVLSSGLR
jgi:hypothetical protein